MKPEEFEVYVIPPNFMEGGTLFGGLLKTRNTIEAVILGLAVGVPVLHLPFSLTVRVVILCLTALPLVLLALIGVSGMSLSAFIRLFFCFLHNRRILSRDGTQGGKNGKTLLPSWAQQRKSDCEAEDPPLPKSRSRFSVDLKQRSVTQFKTFLQEEEAVQPLNALADYIPIEKIEHGVIYTRDHRYVKVVEVVPVNFLLRSAREQRSIIYSFISYLKIAPVKVQFKALTKRADINRHLDTVRRELEHEQDPRCRVLQEDYLKLIRQLGSREAITRRFFLVFEYEPLPGTKRGHEEEDAIASLQTAARTAANYLRQCGNEVISPENEDDATAEILYNILCRRASSEPFYQRVKSVLADYMAAGRDINTIPVNEFYAPDSIDLNSLIIVDIFDSRVYKNANIAILGTSGAGKTFTLQLMALRMRRKGIQVFIIAPLKGHEFHRACSNIGGQFISISPASQNCINIMEIRKADKSVDDLLDGPGTEKSLLAAKIQRLHTFFSLLIPDMSHEERQLLDDAMICTYGTKGITHDNASLEQPKNPGCYKEMPILGDLYEILAASPETKRLANILNRLVNGSARSFNQQTNVALDNKYIVLDISELTGDLLTVGMFVALDFVWDKAKENRTAEKAIFVDECWQLIGASSNRQAAESVLELAKTIRGYGGSLVCATQDLNDFFALDDGKYGKGIINNSKTKILLNLEEEEAQRVQGVLHLSEAELMEITHFERGSALISTNNNNIAVEIKCSQMEKELITTDRRELAELAQRAAPKQHPC